jgi:hypothetical protein
LEGLFDPLPLGSVRLNEPFAVASQVPQFPDRRRRHEAAAQQPVLEQFGEPLGIEHIALVPGQNLQVLGVDQLQLERPFFEHVPDRLPVRAGGLHRDVGHAALGETSPPSPPGRR